MQLHRVKKVGYRGFTIVELMITLAIAAIGLALAVPTVENITQRRHATAKAEQLASFLAFARSEAVKSNRQISVQLTRTDANSWCIGADEGPAGCDCFTANSCIVGTTEVRMDSVEQPKSKLEAFEPSGDATFVFDPVRGTLREDDLEPREYQIRSDNDEFELQVNVSPTGRVRVCNPDADRAVPGFKECTVVPIIIGPGP